MDFEVGFIFIVGYLLSLAKSQTRFHVYYSSPGQEYQSYYTLPGNHWTEFSNSRQTTYPYYSFPKNAFWYSNYNTRFQNLPQHKMEAINTGRYVLVYQKNYPVQYGPPERHTKNFNTNVDYKINNNEIDHSRNKDFDKYNPAIYFEEYPHLKSLLKHQKTRRSNRLPPLKLKSLRLDSPFFRF